MQLKGPWFEQATLLSVTWLYFLHQFHSQTDSQKGWQRWSPAAPGPHSLNNPAGIGYLFPNHLFQSLQLCPGPGWGCMLSSEPISGQGEGYTE